MPSLPPAAHSGLAAWKLQRARVCYQYRRAASSATPLAHMIDCSVGRRGAVEGAKHSACAGDSDIGRQSVPCYLVDRYGPAFGRRRFLVTSNSYQISPFLVEAGPSSYCFWPSRTVLLEASARVLLARRNCPASLKRANRPSCPRCWKTRGGLARRLVVYRCILPWPLRAPPADNDAPMAFT